jgi:acetyl-CoA carboxylase beta subunit
LIEKGALDQIVDRRELQQRIAVLLDGLMPPTAAKEGELIDASP